MSIRFNILNSNEAGSVYAIHRVWFVWLYGKIIQERQRVDYRPYRRYICNLLHNNASTPCALQTPQINLFAIKLLLLISESIIKTR